MIAHTTPNGSTLVLVKQQGGKCIHIIATPTSRQGVLEWLLKNSRDSDFNDQVVKFLDAEMEAARQHLSGEKEKPKMRKTTNSGVQKTK